MFSFFAILVVSVVVNADPLRVADSPRGLSSRIVGGENATIKNYPYQVSIHWVEPPPSSFQCGGAIISAYYIVTAAHCTWYMEDKHIIRAGSSLRKEGGSVHEVESFKVHDNHTFNQNGIALYDVAVVRVKQPFHFDETRQPIELLSKEVRPGSMATVTGWGGTSDEDPSLPNNLQVVNIPIVDKKDCDRAYVEEGGLPEAQICAGYLGQGGKGTCNGDSGGPLVVDGKLAGIVSWGRECAGPKYPGVFTEVARVKDWIIKNTGL